MKVIKHNAVSATLVVPSANTEKLNVFLTSDVHYDSSICAIDLLTKHLKMAEEKQAPVLIAGDFFDVMQSKYDPRKSMEELKDKYKVSEYLDAIVLDASEYLRGFNIPWLIIGLGNHETVILDRQGTNLCERLAYDMRMQGVNAIAMDYWAYIRIQFRYGKGNKNASRTIYYHHGNGGNAPVTHGILDANRQSVWIRDADIVLNGHNHKNYMFAQAIERVSQKAMMPYNDVVWYLRTPGYKKSPGEIGRGIGFGAEKHRAPTSKGGVMIEFEYNAKSNKIDMRPQPYIV